jgi:hypothetical protein
MRVGVNEFLALVNCLPMAAVCHEARSHAMNFCRSQVTIVDLRYSTDAQCAIADEPRPRGLLQPTTVVVTKSRFNFPGTVKDFESPGHLADVVTELFGNNIERLVLNIWASTEDTLETLYWPHSAQTWKHDDL